MIALALLCAMGLAAGFVLLVRIPLCSGGGALPEKLCSLVIPARDEERTLPKLLASIDAKATTELETLVVDDHSTDRTAALAAEYLARVLEAPALLQGWTGKTAACAYGATEASGDLLLFLDADTWFERGGLERLLRTYSAFGNSSVALSVAPYHVTREPYEELSLFFNLMMVFGAGGFGLLGKGRLFGQSLLVDRALYERSGGHAAVRAQILENVAMAERIATAGGRCVCRGGRGVLSMRMFPEGAAQMCAGWTKAFASGAAAADGVVLTVAVFWLTAMTTTVLLLLLGASAGRAMAAIFYLLFALQTAWLARQIGSFRWYTFVLYPVPLVFFFAIFFRSLKRRVLKQQVTWRARQL